MKAILHKHKWVIGFWILAGALLFVVVPTRITRAEVTSGLDPESGAATCPAGFELEDFEDGTDGYRGGGGPIVSKIPGVEFVTTDGHNWLTGDWALGYNGKYPNGAYTSGGQKWAWLGTAQGSGIIDFTDGLASYVSVYTSTYSGLILEAYADDGTLLETSDWADRNIRTGTMTQLSISRPTADIGYVVVHDTGNFWLMDWLCVSKNADTITVQEVDIDIKPGVFPKSISRKSKRNIPVALFGSETFDVATVVSDTVLFDNASPDQAGALRTEKSQGDVNGDGYRDLMFHFDIQSLRLLNVEPVSFPDETNEICLTGSTTDGTRFKGCDAIKIVK